MGMTNAKKIITDAGLNEGAGPMDMLELISAAKKLGFSFEFQRSAEPANNDVIVVSPHRSVVETKFHVASHIADKLARNEGFNGEQEKEIKFSIVDEILMPESSITEGLAYFGGHIRPLAELFNLPYEMIERRQNDLGLVDEPRFGFYFR